VTRWLQAGRIRLHAAGREVRRHALRSALTVTCVALGAAGAMASANYVEAGCQRLLAEIQKLGTGVIVVSPRIRGNAAARARGGRPLRTLTVADYRALRARVPGIARGSGLVNLLGRLRAKGFTKNAGIVGCEPDYFAIKSWSPIAGALFDAADARRATRVAVLGFAAANELFGTAAVVGERLFINRVPFDIIGVLAERGAGRDLSEEDKQVFVPLGTAMRRLQNVDELSGLLLEVGTGASMNDTVSAVSGTLAERAPAAAGSPALFDVQNQQALIDEQLAAAAKLAFFVTWIRWSALGLASGGVLAITWLTVRQRTAEIGTRRAIGATSGQIFAQFACEAALLAGAGCILGLGVGWLATTILLAQGELPAIFDLAHALSATLAAGTASVLCAGLPACYAARLDPAAALAA
jgi:putative ABC transport system permease protein